MSGVVAPPITSISTKIRQLSRLSQKLLYVESAPYLSHRSAFLQAIQFDFNFWRLSERIRQKFFFLWRGAEDSGKIFHGGKSLKFFHWVWFVLRVCWGLWACRGLVISGLIGGKHYHVVLVVFPTHDSYQPQLSNEVVCKMWWVMCVMCLF